MSESSRCSFLFTILSTTVLVLMMTTMTSAQCKLKLRITYFFRSFPFLSLRPFFAFRYTHTHIWNNHFINSFSDRQLRGSNACLDFTWTFLHNSLHKWMNEKSLYIMRFSYTYMSRSRICLLITSRKIDIVLMKYSTNKLLIAYILTISKFVRKKNSVRGKRSFRKFTQLALFPHNWTLFYEIFYRYFSDWVNYKYVSLM